MLGIIVNILNICVAAVSAVALYGAYMMQKEEKAFIDVGPALCVAGVAVLAIVNCFI